MHFVVVGCVLVLRDVRWGLGSGQGIDSCHRDPCLHHIDSYIVLDGLRKSELKFMFVQQSEKVDRAVCQRPWSICIRIFHGT